MKKLTILAVLTVSGILLTGCATVKIYSDVGLKDETGLRFYTLKPYLLVEQMANKDNTVKTSVVFLPDLSSPQYIKVKPGIGSSELKMTFKSSALESYGVITDSQLAESMEAFAAILSKSAYAAQTFTGREPDGTMTQEQETPFRLFEILPTSTGTVLKEVLP
ncbi:MAG: hypothetical protein RQ737_12260 [Bacteroidales bacterium]|nr:hypothetical protein [Bacteroidales bacterium]